MRGNETQTQTPKFSLQVLICGERKSMGREKMCLAEKQSLSF